MNQSIKAVLRATGLFDIVVFVVTVLMSAGIIKPEQKEPAETVFGIFILVGYLLAIRALKYHHDRIDAREQALQAAIKENLPEVATVTTTSISPAQSVVSYFPSE